MRNLSLRIKLSLAFLFVALLVTSASVYTIYGLHTTQGLLLNIIDNDLQRIQILREIRFINLDTQRDIQEISAGTTPHSLQDQGVSAADHLKANQAELNKQVSTYRRLAEGDTSPQTSRKFDQIATQSSQLLQNALQVVTTTNPSQQKATLNKLDTEEESVAQLISQVLLEEQNNVETDDAKADDTIAHLTLLAWTTSGGALVISLLFGLLMANFLARRIERLRQSADSIASGNLAAEIPTRPRDEIGYLGTSLTNMTLRLRDSYGRLTLEKQRDETLLQSMGEGLVALDEQGRIVLINSAATQLLGLTAAANLTAHPLAEVITLQDQKGNPIPQPQLPSSLTLATGRVMSDVYTYQTNDRKVLLNVTATPVVLHGRVAGVILMLRDVTKEKEVDRMKTEFISLASHQLRTPLSAIKWFSEMLVSGDAGELKPEQLDFAKNISDSTERMIALVNSLLNISRIESGRIIVDPKPTDLKELVTGIINDLKAKTAEKQQTLIVSVHSDLPKINLDPRLIGQVYLNLLTNAIKYSPKSSEISVFISKKDNDIISQVTDNGYGIPKDQQGRIFQKFFRAENVAKHETDGTGLGLYLIKAIVESSGGRIWFESEENKGTTFWFSLPMSGMKAKEGEVTLDA